MIPAGAILFRCDGGTRVGAGHIARCLQIAAAFRHAGKPIVFVGRYEDLPGQLVTRAKVPTVLPSGGPAGVPAGAGGVVVDSYEIAANELLELERSVPVAAIIDGEQVPEVTAVLSYRSDADRLRIPRRTTGILGADYAPVSPVLTRGRRRRDFKRLLVTMGASGAGLAALPDVVRALAELDVEIFVAGVRELPAEMVSRGRLEAGIEPTLVERICWADAAVAAAGTTAYDFACAGLPALLQPIAANQEPFAKALATNGVALLAARGNAAALAQSVDELADPRVRERLAVSGPALIDGYGAYRARDAILDAFSGRRPMEPLRYRPATPADGELILRWRNDPATRAASRRSELIDHGSHARWLNARLERIREPLLIVEASGGPVGSVRFDRAGNEAEISIGLDPASRGAGIGQRAIRETCEFQFAADPGLLGVVATVRRGNVASEHAFAHAGFAVRDSDPEWLRMRLARPGPGL